MSQPRQIRIFLVDDHAVVRQGFAALLRLQADFVVAGHAASAREAIDLYPRLRPDVVLMDLNLPDADGTVAIQAIVEQDPAAQVAVLTMYDDEQRLLQAMRCGAKTYLLKSAEPETLFDTIRTLAATAGSNGASRNLIERSSALNRNNASLSPREFLVLTQIAHGKSNDEIASALFMSVNTVKTHVRSVLAKFDAKSRTAAVAHAVRQGIIGIGGTTED